MKNNSSPKLLGIMAFLVLALGGGATYFQYQNVQTAKAKAAALDAQLPSQKDLERDLADTTAKLADFQKVIGHLEANVPDVAYIPTMLKELETIGKGHRIVVTAVRPAPQTMAPKPAAEEGQLKAAKKDYAEIEIEVKGRGSYDDIKAFLDSLQKFPKVIAVKTVGLTPIRETDAGRKDQIEVMINVVAYVFPYEFILGQNTKPLDQQAGQSAPTTASQPPMQESPSQRANTTFTEATETMRLAKKGGKQ